MARWQNTWNSSWQDAAPGGSVAESSALPKGRDKDLQDSPSVGRAEDRPQQAVSGWTVGRGLLACSYSALCLTLVVALMTSLACMFSWTLIPRTFHSSRPLHFDYRQPLPSAEMWLLPAHVLSRARAAAEKWPGHAAGPHLLPRGRVYRASLELKLPESDHNLQLGMFQVSAEALAVGGELLAHSTVPCMLRWRSSVIRYLRTIFLWAPLALGFVEERQQLDLVVLRSKEAILPLAGIRISLAPKAGLLPSEGLPELYSATLTVTSSLFGLTHLFTFLRWTAAVWTVLGFLLCSILLLLLCCQKILAPGLWTQPATGDGPTARPVSRDVGREAAGGMGVAKEVAALGRDMPTLEVSSLDEGELKGPVEVLSDEVYLGMASEKAAHGKETGASRAPIGLRFRPGAQQFSRDDSVGGLSVPSGEDMEAWDCGEVEDGGGFGMKERRGAVGEKEVEGGGLPAVANGVSEGVGRARFAARAGAGGVMHGAQKAVEKTADVSGQVQENSGLGLGLGLGRGGGQVSEEAGRAQAHASNFLEGLVDGRRGENGAGEDFWEGEDSELNDFVGEFGEGMEEWDGDDEELEGVMARHWGREGGILLYRSRFFGDLLEPAYI